MDDVHLQVNQNLIMMRNYLRSYRYSTTSLKGTTYVCNVRQLLVCEKMNPSFATLKFCKFKKTHENFDFVNVKKMYLQCYII